MEEPGSETERRSQPVVPVEPTCLQGLPAQGKSRTTVGLPLRRSDAQLSAEVDRSVAVAAAAIVSETGRDVAQAPRRNPELLPDQGPLWGSRGGEREHSHVDQPRARVSESPLPATEGQAHGRGQHRIHRGSHGQASSLKWPIGRILAQSRYYKPLSPR